MIYGPFKNESEACEAFAALQNREEQPARFVAALHPLASLTSKWVRAEGKAEVVLQLAEWGYWYEPNPPPVSHVTVLAKRQTESGQSVPVCCLLHIHAPTRLHTETFLTLDNGWVRSIFVYSVWLNPNFPFPERVAAVVARLRLKGVPLVSAP